MLKIFSFGLWDLIFLVSFFLCSSFRFLLIRGFLFLFFHFLPLIGCYLNGSDKKLGSSVNISLRCIIFPKFICLICFTVLSCWHLLCSHMYNLETGIVLNKELLRDLIPLSPFEIRKTVLRMALVWSDIQFPIVKVICRGDLRK